MGLLDDAIREHLDLKRRRGADPTEVEREEREVLGPVRRRGEPASDDEYELEYGLKHDPLEHDDAYWDDGGSEAPGAAEAPRATTAFDHEQIAPFAPEPFAAIGEDPDPYAPVERASYAAEPEAEPRPHHADAGYEPPPEEKTAEFSVEESMAPEDHAHVAGDEDVLEETPEFLQDTPDHDRLWFEQRPPRDFDFDG